MKLRIRTMIWAAVLAVCLAGCSATGISGGTSDAGQVTTDFLEDTVFTVADMRVSLAEWYLYALPQAAEIENMYGTEIWDYPTDSTGQTMADALKEDIREQITYIKITGARAAELGLSLGEDDLFDINLQTEEYMSSLSEEQRLKYGITEDVVRQIYSDNVLAMKVYENLTLNIDTSIPDEQVRHMVLEYIMILKDYEDEDGEFVRYSDSELDSMRSDAEALLEQVLADSSITRLDEINDDRYSVVELVADLAELKEKLPGEIPEIAFSMRQDEITGVYETDDALFILDCVERTDETTTDKARIEIIEARQQALFEKKYGEWENEAVIKYNYKLWDSLGVR